jgi:hypothetical protein
VDTLLSNTSTGQIKQDIFEKLEEKYLKTSTELGIAKESEIRELISGFTGQVLPGHLFGMDGTILLPHINEVVNFIDIDGNGDVFEKNFVVEIDALAKGNENWIVEVKWKNEPCRPSDIDLLLKKKQFIEHFLNLNVDTLWLISKNGFTEKTIDMAQKNNVLLTDGDELHSLKKVLSK